MFPKLQKIFGKKNPNTKCIYLFQFFLISVSCFSFPLHTSVFMLKISLCLHDYYMLISPALGIWPNLHSSLMTHPVQASTCRKLMIGFKALILKIFRLYFALTFIYFVFCLSYRRCNSLISIFVGFHIFFSTFFQFFKSVFLPLTINSSDQSINY